MLVSPGHFEWAKEFLVSGAVAYMSDNKGISPISIPKNPPAPLLCISDQAVTDPAEKVSGDEDVQVEALMCQETDSHHAERAPSLGGDEEVAADHAVLEKHGNSGFKSSSCTSRKCTSCDPPPTLSNKVIRNLGSQFCSMNMEDLGDENLQQGGGKEPVGRKRTKTASSIDSKTSKNGQECSKTGGKKGQGSSKNRSSAAEKP